MVSILLPISICVILPIAVVLIISLAKMNADNKRSQILIKAIEANKDVDTDKLLESLEATKQASKKTPRELLNLRLLRGCIFSFGGIFLIILGIVNYCFVIDSDGSSDPVTVPTMFGAISLAIGLSYLIVYFVSRKQIDSAESK